MKKPFAIIVTGATASGKSFFALELAKRISGEIINADIGSFYKPLTIGTAKPDWKNEEISHHLFDILDRPVDYSAVQFRCDVQSLCELIWQRKNIPVIVGGSLFYLKSLFYGLASYEQKTVDDNTAVFEQMSNKQLWEMLQIIDSERASRICLQDRYRLLRALTIFKKTGKKPSFFQPYFDPFFSFIIIDCTPNDRTVLYAKINRRVEEMFFNGWLKEVESLKGSEWESFLLRKRIIGYDDLFYALCEELRSVDRDRLVALIQQKTRNYAKRQITFLKKLKKDITKDLSCQNKIGGKIEQIDLTLCDVGLYISQLLFNFK
ncbi:tRNA (adenosine(37)-N6)-dimethylallyltransferase MiaA [Candidatus Dependentiae bacterium]|nr:tRNA (adenosine(37)-N6)-dimethylallyltransferase MiaA [Candidatus Dependentiae bacterium]